MTPSKIKNHAGMGVPKPEPTRIEDLPLNSAIVRLIDRPCHANVVAVLELQHEVIRRAL